MAMEEEEKKERKKMKKKEEEGDPTENLEPLLDSYTLEYNIHTNSSPPEDGIERRRLKRTDCEMVRNRKREKRNRNGRKKILKEKEEEKRGII